MYNVKSKQESKLPSVEEQIEESIANIKSGNYKTFTIPEYKQELKKRFG